MLDVQLFLDFRRVFDELTEEVKGSSGQFVSYHLENWFAAIDRTPDVLALVKQLEHEGGYLLWKVDLDRARKGVVKALASPSSLRKATHFADLKWPRGPDKRLGLQLSLFREIAKGSVDAEQFGSMYIEKTSAKKNGARELVDQVFLPMARELRRFLQRQTDVQRDVPAADRDVPLDHNSAEYQRTMEALAELEQKLIETNDYPDAADRDQRIAEISAGRRLLTAVRVRLSSLKALLVPALTHLAKKFVDSGIGKAASAAWDALTSLLGGLF